MISERSGRFVIALLLSVKLVLLVWNAAAFDGRTYDREFHADRALVGGLKPGKTAHSSPAYYLPALTVARPAGVEPRERARMGEEDEARGVPLPRAPRASGAEEQYRADLLTRLRYTNVLWVGAFYLIWIYYAFPRLLRGFRPWFLGSLLLLTLPGYQKLAAMSHPDNMFVGSASVVVAIWLFLRERSQGERAELQARPSPSARAAVAVGSIRFWHLVVFALAIGTMLLARPFAVVPAGVFSVLCVAYLLRSVGGNWLKLAPRLLLLGAIVLLPSLSWYGQLKQASHQRGETYVASYFPNLEKNRAGFDYLHYYGSFHLGQLLGSQVDGIDAAAHDSFFTLLYSEVWGDQWRSFSGATAKDAHAKEWPKRVLLASALGVPWIMLALGGRALWGVVQRRRHEATLAELEPELVLLAVVVLGTVGFLVWQAGPGLLPGDNSTVKFIYIATLFPPAIALVFARDLRPITFSALTGYFLSLYVLAFPVAMYWPQ
jgi:hypothetical protein